MLAERPAAGIVENADLRPPRGPPRPRRRPVASRSGRSPVETCGAASEQTARCVTGDRAGVGVKELVRGRFPERNLLGRPGARA